MTVSIGIDLNGLVDQAALQSENGLVLRTGEIPSIVVVPRIQPPRARELVSVSGIEASRSLEGRGWAWPAAAGAEGVAARIPVAALLKHVAAGTTLPVNGADREPADLLAAAAVGLGAEPRSRKPAVLVVRDNQRIDEATQQRLLDAFLRRGIEATLLWRPVAALLGIEDILNPIAAKLQGKKIGVVSVLEDGVDVSVLEIECRADGNGSYVVPVRDRPGIHISFHRSLVACAEELAQAMVPEDPSSTRQLVWGSGAAIRAFLNLEPGETLVQLRGRWKMLRFDGEQAAVGLPKLDPEAIVQARAMLQGVQHVIVEGPGMAATAGDLRLGFALRDALFPAGTSSLADGWLEQGFAAKGAVAYAVRGACERSTYFDHLPRLRLAVRSGDEARFIDLISSDARLEGGCAYDPPPRSLGLWIDAGQTEFDNFLIKGSDPVRIATASTSAVPQMRTEVLVKVFQRPLAGRARITLIPQGSAGLRQIELDWDGMRIDDRSEIQILEALAGGGGRAIPPVDVIDCHPLLWTAGTTPPLADLIGAGRWDIADLRADPFASQRLRAVVTCLRRSDIPQRINAGAAADQPRCRAVGTNGRIPTERDGLDAAVGVQFDVLLASAGQIAVDPKTHADLRSVAVQACTWAFARCPATVVAELTRYVDERNSSIPERVVVQALGRVAGEPGEIQTLFNAVLAETELKIHHIRALTWVLGRVEAAPRQLTPSSAERLAQIAIYYITSAGDRAHQSQWTSLSLKLLACLLRFRLVSNRFLDPVKTDLGIRARKALETAEVASAFTARNRGFARGVREYLERQGTNDRLLALDDDC